MTFFPPFAQPTALPRPSHRRRPFGARVCNRVCPICSQPCSVPTIMPVSPHNVAASQPITPSSVSQPVLGRRASLSSPRTADRVNFGPPTLSFCCTSHHVSRPTAPTRQEIVYNRSLFTDPGLSVPPHHHPGYNRGPLRTIHSIRRSLNEIFCPLYLVPPCHVPCPRSDAHPPYATLLPTAIASKQSRLVRGVRYRPVLVLMRKLRSSIAV